MGACDRGGIHSKCQYTLQRFCISFNFKNTSQRLNLCNSHGGEPFFPAIRDRDIPIDGYILRGCPIVSHYAALAVKSGIALFIKLTVPAHTEQITDSSLCAIFGNLLKNGIEACNRMQRARNLFACTVVCSMRR